MLFCQRNIQFRHYLVYSSVTGLQAGANISGDLKDPASSIPKGTLLALLLSAISYAVFVVFAGGAAARDAAGVVNGTFPDVADCIANSVCTKIEVFDSEFFSEEFNF